MIKLRIESTSEEIDRFTAYLETLSRIEILSASGNYLNTRSKSKYSRKYFDVDLKQLGTVEEQDKQALKDATAIYDGIKERHTLNTKVKPGVDIQSLVQDKYSEVYTNYLLWMLDWSDIDGVLDYLYGAFFTSPTPPQEVREVIDFIEENCEQ